jgi:hypothetical protein
MVVEKKLKSFGFVHLEESFVLNQLLRTSVQKTNVRIASDNTLKEE